MAIALANNFEGGSNTTLMTTGNSGGTSGNAFDLCNPGSVSPTFSSTHAAHGSLAMQVTTTTAAQPFCQWFASITGGPYGTLWMREYLYFTANPTNQHKSFVWATSAANAGSVFISTAGKILLADSGGTVRVTSTASIPLNAWFRLEGFCVGSATVGQLGFSMWTTSMDSAGAADETQTSAASFNTLGLLTKAIVGCQSSVASVGPYWIDDYAISSTGAIGPVSSGSASPNAGLAASSGAAPSSTPTASVNMTIMGI
jgi:hypothetical protein